MNQKKKITPGGIIARVLLILWAVMVLYPLLWTLQSSFKNNIGIFTDPWALPDRMHWENYVNAWTAANISTYFFNTLLVVGGTALLLLLLSSTTAFVLAKYRFPGRGFLENVYVACTGVPMVLVLVPLFFLCNTLHLTNNLWGLILVYPVLYLPFSIFLLMGFFKGVPNSLLEAAMIDGASEYGIFFRVTLPLVKSGLLIVTIVNVMNYWNEYTFALTFLSDETKFTLSIGINYLSSAMQYRTDFGALFAGLVISMIPVLVLYAIFNKQLQEGMAVNSAVKG